MVRKVPERAALPISSDPALRAALLDVLQQDGYAINQLLGAFETGTFTPTFTFATPGDLSVVYAAQEGAYWRLGALLFIQLRLGFTPTHTTASGAATLGGLPYANASAGVVLMASAQWNGAGLTYPTGRTTLWGYVNPAESSVLLAADGSTVASSGIGASNVASGTAVTDLRIAGFYPGAFEHP